MTIGSSEAVLLCSYKHIQTCICLYFTKIHNMLNYILHHIIMMANKNINLIIRKTRFIFFEGIFVSCQGQQYLFTISNIHHKNYTSS